MYNVSVIAKMPPLLLLLLVLPLSICVSSKQYGTGENVEDDLEEKMYKREKLDDMEDKFQELIQRMDNRWKMEKDHLEKKLETKNVEIENLQKQLKEMEVQFESRMDEVMLSTQKNQEVASLKMQIGDIHSQLKEVKAERKNERGLRDLPFEMVCAFKDHWYDANSVVSYNRTTAEFNNSDRPGGADGTMNIETGVFTTITSGYYIITFSGSVALAGAGESTVMYLHHNGAPVEESRCVTAMGGSVDRIQDQASRTVVSRLLVLKS